MLRPTFLKASLENIALITSQAGHHADDLLEKRPAALPAPLKLGEHRTVLQKENAAAVAWR